jgi:hypothetical protein
MSSTFPPTQPGETSGLMHVSDFRRDTGREGDSLAGSTRVTSLQASLLQDLQRFVDGNPSAQQSLELLEVMAAAVRHGRALLVHVQHDYRVLPLTVFPTERQLHCPVPQHALLALPLPELRVLRIEPARVEPPATARDGPEASRYGPLQPLLWELALRGSRDTLLPEIAGHAAYRIPPGAEFGVLGLEGSLEAAVQRMRRQTTNLRELEQWPGFDRERAMRLLNALYLQSALIVSRAHPAATNDDWPPATD